MNANRSSEGDMNEEFKASHSGNLGVQSALAFFFFSYNDSCGNHAKKGGEE